MVMSLKSRGNRTILGAVCAIGLFGVANTAAAAQEGVWQVEVSLGQIADDNFDTDGIVARLGHEWPTYGQFGGLVDAMAVEVEGFYGVNGDEQATANGLTEAKIEYAGSANLRLIKNIGANFDLFGRVGVGYAQPEVLGQNAQQLEEQTQGSDMLVGAGAALRFAGNTALRFDYAMQNEFESFSLALRWEF